MNDQLLLTEAVTVEQLLQHWVPASLFWREIGEQDRSVERLLVAGLTWGEPGPVTTRLFLTTTIAT